MQWKKAFSEKFKIKIDPIIAILNPTYQCKKILQEIE